MAKKQKKIPKQRNPFVEHVMFKSGAGVHEKPYKVQRAADKRFVQAFKRNWGKLDPNADLGI